MGRPPQEPISPDTTILQFVTALQKLMGGDPKEMKLIYLGKGIDMTKLDLPLRHYDIQHLSTVLLHTRAVGGSISVVVRNMLNQEEPTIQIPRTATVKQLKDKIFEADAEMVGLLPEGMSIVFNSKLLENDSATLASEGVANNSTLDMHRRSLKGRTIQGVTLTMEKDQICDVAGTTNFPNCKIGCGHAYS